MVDSVAVFPPGWQMPDDPATGLPYPDGIIEFYDAGTSNPRDVYLNSNLTTSLGPVIVCNSMGFPTTAAGVKVTLYTGTSPYKIRITSVTYGGTVFEQDNLKGAFDTSAFLTSTFTPGMSILPISENKTVVLADKGTLLNVNSTSADLTITFDDASDLGDNFWIGIRHAGTANRVRISGNGTDTFALNRATTTSFSLTGLGHTVFIGCNGAAFIVYNQMPAFIGNTVGVIRILDRLSTPPTSPLAGDRYIVTASPTGDWSTFANHDIAEYGGNGWFRYTPPANCGWRAFVVDEQLVYQFRSGGWLSELATDTATGTVVIASQVDMEAATSTVRAVTPGRQRLHWGHPKVVMHATVPGGTPTLGVNNGISSLVDGGVGSFGINYSTSFSTASYNALGNALSASGTLFGSDFLTQGGSSIILRTGTLSTGTQTDPAAIYFTAQGDYAPI